MLEDFDHDGEDDFDIVKVERLSVEAERLSFFFFCVFDINSFMTDCWPLL